MALAQVNKYLTLVVLKQLNYALVVSLDVYEYNHAGIMHAVHLIAGTGMEP